MTTQTTTDWRKAPLPAARRNYANLIAEALDMRWHNGIEQYGREFVDSPSFHTFEELLDLIIYHHYQNAERDWLVEQLAEAVRLLLACSATMPESMFKTHITEFVNGVYEYREQDSEKEEVSK